MQVIIAISSPVMNSVLACSRLGIGYQTEHHASHLKSWSKALKEGGSKELLKVLWEARQTADPIAPAPVLEQE